MALEVITHREIEESDPDLDQAAWNLLRALFENPICLATVRMHMEAEDDDSMRVLAQHYLKNMTLQPVMSTLDAAELRMLGFKLEQ